MVLTKDEFLSALRTEIRIVLHLASKADAAALGFRPTPKQRSTLEILQYLTILGPIHIRGVVAPSFDMEGWRAAWRAGQAAAKVMNLEQATAAIGALPALFAEVLGPCSDADLRAPIEMFGHKATRGSMLVSLVLCHYTAYRMQLFMNLKGSGGEELGTMNLWAGMDGPSRP